MCIAHVYYTCNFLVHSYGLSRQLKGGKNRGRSRRGRSSSGGLSQDLYRDNTLRYVLYGNLFIVFSVSFPYVQVRELPKTHQECIELLISGGWAVQRDIEYLLDLRPGTLNHPQWTRIVHDRYRKLLYKNNRYHAGT